MTDKIKTLGNNEDRFLAVARKLDHTHGTHGALAALVKCSNNKASVLYTEAFEEHIVKVYFSDKAPEWVETVLSTRIRSDGRAGTVGSVDSPDSDILITFRVKILKADAPKNEKNPNAKALVSWLRRTEPAVISPIVETVEDIAEALQAIGFHYIRDEYKPRQQYSISMGQGKVSVTILFWIDDTIKAVMF